LSAGRQSEETERWSDHASRVTFSRFTNSGKTLADCEDRGKKFYTNLFCIRRAKSPLARNQSELFPARKSTPERFVALPFIEAGNRTIRPNRLVPAVLQNRTHCPDLKRMGFQSLGSSKREIDRLAQISWMARS
jgi:hypothetical protein